MTTGSVDKPSLKIRGGAARRPSNKACSYLSKICWFLFFFIVVAKMWNYLLQKGYDTEECTCKRVTLISVSSE